MDVSAEALSELKLVRSFASPPPPARPGRAREPNVFPRARRLGPRMAFRKRFAVSPRGLTRSSRLSRFPQALTSSLEREGVLAKLKAQLRAHVFEAVQRRGGADVDGRAFSRTPEGALMTELVSEYLECLGLDYSKRVFDAESGAEELASRRDRAALARDVGVAPPADDATPLLSSALGERMKGSKSNAKPAAETAPSPSPEPRKVAGNIIVSDDSDSADIETDVDIDYSDAGTSG